MKSKNNFTEEFVNINGIMQYFLHYPVKNSDIAVIFIHGGPGQSEEAFAYYLSKYWDYCNIVYYCQRGAGKTQKKNKTKPENITVSNLLEDLRLTIEYIKQKYKTDKIILAGHSWGSVLGLIYAGKYPENILCYVGYGQVVDIIQGEKTGYDKLKEMIYSSGKKRDIKRLESLGEYPDTISKDNFKTEKLRFRKLQGKYGLMAGSGKAAKIAVKSPVFKLTDLWFLINSLKLNKNIIDYMINFSFLKTTQYDIPIYFILGRNDWQMPSVLAEKYLDSINARKKKVYWIENAGHSTDIDNPLEFNNALKDIIKNI